MIAGSALHLAALVLWPWAMGVTVAVVSLVALSPRRCADDHLPGGQLWARDERPSWIERHVRVVVLVVAATLAGAAAATRYAVTGMLS